MMLQVRQHVASSTGMQGPAELPSVLSTLQTGGIGRVASGLSPPLLSDPP